jgi:hypothetical protein
LLQGHMQTFAWSFTLGFACFSPDGAALRAEGAKDIRMPRRACEGKI